MVCAHSALPTARLEAAHGSPAELAGITTDQLREWAPRLLQPEDARSFPNLLELAAHFSKPQQPLVAKEPADVKAMLEAPSP